jgi:hypothetical protein
MLKLRFSTPKGLARGASRLQAGEGAEAELPPDAEAALQHSKQVSVRLTPLPQRGRGAGGEGILLRALDARRDFGFGLGLGLGRVVAARARLN